MITQISKEGAAGGGPKTETDRGSYCKENALDLLELDLSLDFKPIVVEPDHVILESYNEDCTWVEHRYYEGYVKDMQNLTTLAKARMVADTVPA